jgi:predicted HicB family RNase H-like nuclease
MKRILKGVTYSTDTSMRVARSRRDGPNESEKFVETLYQTRGGAYFLVKKRTVVKWDERERENAPRNEWSFQPVSVAEAQEWMRKWMLEGEVQVFHNPFGDDPPEAAAEAEPGATIYVRLPATLKRAADAAAREQNLSGNVWAMQCIERCLENRSLQDVKDLACIWKIAQTFRAHRGNGEWTPTQLLDAMAVIADCAYAAGSKLFGSEALDSVAAKLDGDPGYQKISKKLKPYT